MITTMERENAAEERLRRLIRVQTGLIGVGLAILVAIWFGVQRLQVLHNQLADKSAQVDRQIKELKALSDSLLEQRQQYQAELNRARDILETARTKTSASELRQGIDATLKATEHISPVPPRIHILYAGKNQVVAATQLASALQQNHFTVRTPSNIEGTSGRPANDMTQVRFMHPEDRSSALDVLAVLQSIGVQHARISYVPDRGTPAGRIEIWFETGDVH